MPGRYFPYTLKHYTPVMRPMPVPGIESYDECPAVCVRFSEKLVPYLLGLLEIYRWRDNFEGTDDEINTALGVVQDLMVALQEACVCCCDDEKLPLQYRYTPDGKLEISDDGGVTWRDGSAYDTREQVPMYPPTLPDGSECLYAENIADKIKEIVDLLVTQANAGSDAVTAASAVIGILLAIGFPAAPLAVFLILVYGLFAAVFSLVSGGLSGTFDAQFWADFKCYWYCAISPDGEVTDSTIEQVKQKVIERFTTPNPIAVQVIFDAITMLGTNGLTNAARMGDSILNGDCESCDCDPEWCHEFDFLTTNGSFQNVSGSNYGSWVSGQGWVSELVSGSGGQSIWIKRDFTATITRVEIDVTWTTGSGRNIQVNTQDTQLITDVGSAPLSHTFTWDGLRGATQLVLNPSGGAGNVVRITRLLVRGTGTNPFGTDNCA